MIFSVSHHSGYKKDAGEIRCPYNQLGLIFEFIKDNPNKRYNIIIGNGATQQEINRIIEQVDYVKEVAEDYTIECGSLVMLQDLLSRGYNAYLKFPVIDWETFSDLISIGVTDIYIDGPIGFNIDSIKRGKGNVKIRVSPTISPNTGIAGRQPNSFFIRPEDLSLYEDAIDVIDFHEVDINKEDSLYSIYNRGTFNYDINYLISGLPQVNNLLIAKDFAQSRLNCRQACKIPGRSCHICSNNFLIVEKSLELAQKE